MNFIQYFFLLAAEKNKTGNIKVSLNSKGSFLYYTFVFYILYLRPHSYKSTKFYGFQ